MKTNRPAREETAGLNIHGVAWILLGFFMLALIGCAGKFSQTTEADVGFFADNTIAMLRDANLGFSRGKALYTKEFYDYEAPEEISFINNRDRADYILKVMVTYSLKLVQIAEAEETQAGRVKAYASFIEGTDDKELAAIQTSRAELDELVKKIRQQEKFMDALQIAQPLINAMGRYMSTVLDNFKEDIDILVNKTEQRIDKRYHLVVRYQEGLEAEKYAILEALGDLYHAAKGDAEAYRRVIDGDAIMKKSVIPGRQPTEENIQTLAEYLVKRLDGLHRIQQEVEPDWKLYRATMNELDELNTLFMQEIRQFRLITIVWMRAHQKMASGKIKPAEWFDINNAPGTLIKMGTGLI